MAAPAHYLAEEAERKATAAAREMVEKLTKRVARLQHRIEQLEKHTGLNQE